MQDYYTLQVAGVTRQLPIMQISDSLAIASFVILGDCEIVTKSAPLIEKQLPQVDYIVTAEAKGIPSVHELCRLRGLPYYIVARKSVKPYMSQPLTDEGGVHHHAESADAVPGRQRCPAFEGQKGGSGGRRYLHRRIAAGH